MLPLPEPIRGGSLSDLQDFVNVGSRADWVLLASWLVAALRPKGPYPVLVLHGEQGSSKTTTAKLLRALVDPNEAGVRSEPGDERDLMITAVNNWLVAFDNLSHLRSWLSDAICRLATGGGFATRELFTDSEEIIFRAQRPVLLNEIEEIVTRNDLLDRALILYMTSIPEGKRRSESELWADFNRRRPLLLGALLNVVCDALRNLDSVKLDRLPRLADFALWATAAESSLSLRHGEFMDVYSGNRESANTLALEVSSVASAVIGFMINRDAWMGSAVELLGALSTRVSDSTQRQSSWPKNPRALSNHLRRLLPNLRAAGVSVTFTPKAHAGKRLIHLERTEKFAPPSPPSQGI